MKRLLIPFLALALCPPAHADNRSFELIELPPLQALKTPGKISFGVTGNKLWFKIISSTSIRRFSDLLRLDNNYLARLNNVPTSHVFEAGSWLVVPDSARVVAVTLSSLDSSSERESAPPPISTVAKIQRGDSLAAFLKRHGVTKEQLKTYNPGVQLNSLTVGRELQVARAASGESVLAVRPLRSGGAAWPSLPGSYPAQREVPQAMTPERQYVLNQIERARETEQRRQLAAAEARRRQYKTFGDKTYYWAGWKLNDNGTRTTTYTDKYSLFKHHVAVTCKGMQVSTRSYSKWSKWRIPSGDEQRMVIELCSQIPNAPKAAMPPSDGG